MCDVIPFPVVARPRPQEQALLPAGRPAWRRLELTDNEAAFLFQLAANGVNVLAPKGHRERDTLIRNLKTIVERI